MINVKERKILPPNLTLEGFFDKILSVIHIVCNGGKIKHMDDTSSGQRTIEEPLDWRTF